MLHWDQVKALENESEVTGYKVGNCLPKLKKVYMPRMPTTVVQHTVISLLCIFLQIYTLLTAQHS